jgi:hypothetical protein
VSEIHRPAVERIKAQVDPEGFMSLFQAIADDAEEAGTNVGQVCMPYIDESDEFVEGTWVPELWLVARKVLKEDEE